MRKGLGVEFACTSANSTHTLAVSAEPQPNASRSLDSPPPTNPRINPPTFLSAPDPQIGSGCASVLNTHSSNDKTVGSSSKRR
jgi:hypothetical protein